MRMPELNEPQGKIFISYRRSDSPGVAGRLADSLREYFGEDRVFRDIGGIRAGARFDDVIDRTLTGTDALLVLIGPGWVDATGEDGSRRFDDPDDILSREIVHAIENDVPVFPVLVENTRMPAAHELPDRLAPLALLNGLSITDERWHEDVTRLAKIVALDIPGSLAERKLNRMRIAVLTILLAVMVFSTVRFAWTAYGAHLFLLSSHPNLTEEQVIALGKEAEAEQHTVKVRLLPGRTYYTNEPEGWTASPAGVAKWQTRFKQIYDVQFRFFVPLAAVVNYIAIGFACFLLTMHLPLLDRDAQAYVLASVWTGIAGILVFLLLYIISGGPFDTIATYAGSTITITAMLVLMGVSGFKAR